MRQILMFVLLISFINLLPLKAQDLDASKCDNELVTALLARIEEHTDKAANALDPTAAIDELQQISTEIALARAACSGFVFNGDKDSVLGPVDFPEGIYRVTLTATESNITSIATLEGECGEGSGSLLLPGLFFANAGDAENGAETIFTSHECSALLEVSSSGGDWMLVFEKVK